MKNRLLRSAGAFFACIVLIGCSGETSYSLNDLGSEINTSESSNTSSQEHSVVLRQGLFLDAAVEGLEYTHENGDVNITTKGGRFTYTNSEKLSFHIGALSLGTSNGAYIVTPREMVAGTSLLDSTVINNRVRLLLALDSDANRYGIQINKLTRDTAALWPSKIDFTKSAENFETEIATATIALETLLPTALEAKNHIKETLECAYSGAYQGAWDVPESNLSSGYVGVMVRSNRDVVVMGDGQTVGDQNNSVMYVIGRDDVHNKKYSFDNNKFWYYNKTREELELGDSDMSIQGVGNHVSYNVIEGSFVQDNRTGSYTAYKSDATNTAAYRFTGFGNMYGSSGTWTVGMIIIDIDSTGTISGKIHDVRDTQAQPKLSGSVDYATGELSMEVQMPGNISYVTGHIDFLDTTTQSALSWHDKNASVTYGEVLLNGCQLQAID